MGEEKGIARLSIEFHMRAFDDARPLFGFAANNGRELVGRAADRIEAQIAQPLFNVTHLEHIGNRRAQLLTISFGVAAGARHPQYLPESHLSGPTR